MEDDKKVSASSEEISMELAENVQQEAESPTENNADSIETHQESESEVEEPSEAQEVIAADNVAEDSIQESEDKSEGIQEIQSPDETDSDKDQELVEEVVTNEEEVEEPAAEVEAPVYEVESEVISDAQEEVVSEADSAETAEDEHVEEEEDEFADVDLEGVEKKDLLGWLKKISKEENLRKVDRLFKDLGARFEEQYGNERKEALDAFLAIEGNEEGDFDFHGDDIDIQFKELYEKQRFKRSHFFHQLEKEREENLIRKEQILDMIREAVDGEDQTSFNRIKRLQEDWKNVGPVPNNQNRTLWANYHALMDRFYDQRTIYFELKDLDRKKNLEAKIELCEKAESLNPEKNLPSAIKELNDLHEEFKHIGPVPKDDQEALWQRFKTASDHVYDYRKEYTEIQKAEQLQNLEIKEGLSKKAEELANFESDRIKIWNQKTKDLLELQKQWEACGGVPREKAKEVNKIFWGNFKAFFANKNKFFKSLDAEREGNLDKKRALVAKALELRESNEFEKATKTFKDLQNEWKELGPVPEKFRKSIYDEFKGHCDYFFNRRRGQSAEQNQEFQQNLDQKTAILDQLNDLAAAKKLDLDMVYTLTERFSDIGLVPRNSVGKILDRYDAIGKKILSSSELSDYDRSELRMHLDICKLRNSPHGNQKINRKENVIRRKISGLENDLTNWKTNLDFFAKSKNADQLRKDFEGKISEAENELELLKQQLRQLH